jgi:hypothetical protein
MGFEVVRQQDTEWLQCGAMLAQSRLEMDGASAKHLPVGGACQRVAQTTHDSLETSVWKLRRMVVVRNRPDYLPTLWWAVMSVGPPW